MALKDKQVTFKIELAEYELLARGAEREGKAANVYAREIVLRALDGAKDDLAEIRDGVQLVRRQLDSLSANVIAHRAGSMESPGQHDAVQRLRLDLATAVAAILVELRPGEAAESVVAWVKQNFATGE